MMRTLYVLLLLLVVSGCGINRMADQLAADRQSIKKKECVHVKEEHVDSEGKKVLEERTFCKEWKDSK